MKLTGILLFLACIQLHAKTYAQRVSLKVDQASLKDVFSAIQAQSGYDILYGSEVLDRAKPVTLNVKDAPLRTVLDQTLAVQGMTYRIQNKTIAIRVTAAQQDEITVTGSVTDSTGKALPSITVREKGKDRGTITDEQGRFSLKVSQAQAAIVFSSVGYIQQEVALNGRQNISVSLREDNALLSEVVVVGYGVQKKVNVTGAVSTVSGEDVAARPAGQTSAALQGMAPGVTVTQRSGKPGADGGNIRIRGIGTTNSSGAGPMVLIDGIEGSMDNIDPNLIESVSILKDAASSSIYGSRAANGVILVTTKRGVGDRISIGYNNYFGWQDPTNMPKIASALDHMLLTNEAYTNVGSSPLYSDELIEAYRAQNGVSSDEYPNTDWQKETLTGSGFQQSHFLSVNGGTKKVKMLASFGYFDQKGLIENTSFKRYTIRNNIDITFSDKLSAKVDLQYVNPITEAPATGVENIFQWMNGIPANQIGINSNGTWGVGWNGNNPISASQDGGFSSYKAPFGSINASLTYKPFSWLTADVNYAPKYATVVSKKFSKAIQSYLPDGTPSYLTPNVSSLSHENRQDMYNNMRATLTADKSVGDHAFKWMLGASREDFKDEYITAFRDGYALPDYPILHTGSAENQKNDGSAEEWALQSFFSRLNYNYKERYLLEINARYDGSSRFLPGNRYGFFPSVSAGWRFSEEAFMQGLKDIFNEAKLRLSWGRLGNQNIGTYPAVSTLDLGYYTLGGGVVNTAALNNLSNPNITWESTEEKNIGLDLALFNGFGITADYYHRRTDDILLQLDVPLIIGLAAPYQNAGVVENKGWELGLSYHSNAQREFKYSLNLNLSDVHNKVVDMKGRRSTGLTVNNEGYPIGSIFGYIAEGYFQNQEEIDNHATQFGTLAPGDIKYQDQNNDGQITEADKVVIGSTVPRYTFSLNSAFAYKGFDLSLFLQGVGKVDGYLYGAGIQAFTTTGAVGGTIREDNKDRWTPDNPNAKYPRLAFGQNNNQQNSSFWMRNAAYLRLKNVQIGYTVPKQWLNTNKIQRLRIFANGTNLFTADSFLEGYDVEAPVGAGNYYPQVKVYTFGLEATF
ncbi:TonB-dependent receptor [Olivibacter ginsenosidimutans]|uniref:TonB-dependent receptor n=2 Tax=Olivibacter ginsenosidimutans TaxID=1176537 RepID=A0ABP9ARG8_9SPHI